MIELILMYLLVRGAVQAWQETKAAWGKSRKAYMSSAGRRYPGSSPGRRVAQAARHDLGYGLSQLLHGFPTARHGFAQGWNEGKKAHVEARTAREKARTEHAETRAGALAEWRDLRERRREAQEEIRRQQPGEPGEGTSPGPGTVIQGTAEDVPAPVTGGIPDCEPHGAPWPCGICDAEPRHLCWSCFVRDGEKHLPFCATLPPAWPGDTGGPTYSHGLPGAAHHWPSANRDQAERQARAASRDGRTRVVLEYPPGGGPGQVIAAYRDGEPVTEDETAGTAPAQETPSEEGNTSMPPVVLCGHCDAPADGPHDPDCPTQGLPSMGRRRPPRPAPGQETPAGTPITKGTTSMSDVTYDGVAGRMAQAIAAADARGQEITATTAQVEDQHREASAAKQWASVTSDEMQALNMDPATLGAMADHLDAADEAEKAYASVLEALARAAKAQARTLETAQAVDAALRRGHSGIKQAHDDAPVEAADREFYQA